MKGVFVTFEGIDGSGKTTQIDLLYNYLKSKDFNVVLTREPGGTLIGDEIRSILLNPQNRDMSFRTETFLFQASRSELVDKVIFPALSAGKIVICDRFFDSTYAYQAIARNLGVADILKMNLWATSGLTPDLTFLLSMKFELGEERIASQSKSRDRIEYEEKSFKEKVQIGYAQVAKDYPHRIKVIDASKDKESIFISIKKETENLLKKRRLL